MLSLSNVGKGYGDRTLFAGATLQLDAGNRYGLVGANGSGKTTLLSILAGDDSPTDGEITAPQSVRIGVLRQNRYLDDAQRILDVAMMGDRDVWSALTHKAELLASEHPDAAAIAEVEDRIARHDGYSLEARAGAILEGLGIPAKLHDEPLSMLAGGFKLRVLLAQTLVGKPDVLLLDEPTNHLDILTIRWLEEFLCDIYTGCAVVISHDHRFLDNVATHILDIDYEVVTLYPGNYSRFIEEKRRTRERKETELERQEQLIAEKRAFVEKYRAKKTRARQALSRMKQLERIESTIQVLPRSSRRAPVFRFEQTRPSGREVLDVRGLDKAYGDHRVLTDVSLSVRRGEKVGVIGANGLGKSTLLKAVIGRLSHDDGEVRWGYETHIGYFPQDHKELLDTPDMTALDYLWNVCPREPTSFVRGQLGRLLFSGEEVDKKVRSLSGGEAARLIFSRLVVQKPNVLVLDEPTNHLDLEAIEALAGALREYEGTVLFVSHDRWFVSQLASRILEIRADGIEDYPGTYDDYVARDGTDHLDAAAVVERARRERAEARETSGDWRAQKKRRSEQQKLLGRRDKITEEIAQAEARLERIRALYCEPGFFETTPADEVQALQREEADLSPKIEQLMSEWEAIETALEELGEP